MKTVLGGSAHELSGGEIEFPRDPSRMRKVSSVPATVKSHEVAAEDENAEIVRFPRGTSAEGESGEAALADLE